MGSEAVPHSLCRRQRHVEKPGRADRKRRDQGLGYLLVRPDGKYAMLGGWNHADCYLKCIHALGGGDFLLLNDYQELVNRGVTPEQEILTRYFCYFGPVPDAILKVAGDWDWSAALEGAAKIADAMVKDEPGLRFERWGEELGSEALRMISGMTALYPEARLGIDQVMAHPSWLEDE
jgi:hypothetical protein